MPVGDAGEVASVTGESPRKRWRTLQNRIERARGLRRAGNNVEQAIWELLCTQPLVGVRFQRQVPIGPYLAPFACMARKLVIEIDSIDGDRPRHLLMEQLGWRVVRLASDDVLHDPRRAWAAVDELLHGR
ncbi:endonuclease domain-containing protein [Reyranella sp.]|uniref:endonuclease domain-containing protein n=1 Tax=Reyranella sp. TaxID=1929291 RepID=UPI003BAA1288